MSVASDAALITRTRSGDMGAYDELYRRHVDDATKVARIVMSNDDEAQDIVSEAFMRVLRRLQDGGGPEDDLAPYLRTVVRRLAIDHYRSAQRSPVADPSTFDVMPRADDPIAKATDRQLVRRAFEELPARWQEVLWHTEIEGRSAGWLAERFGTSPNSVAALAYRAREGLRQAYLSMNIRVQDRPECRPFARKIPALVRGTLPARQTRPLLDHLEGCAQCRERRDELYVLVADLPAALWPALLLPIAGPNIAAGATAATGAGGGLLAWLTPSNWGRKTGRTVAVSATVVAAAAIAAAAMLVASYTPESPPAAAPPPQLEQQPQGPAGATEQPEKEPPPDESTAEPPSQLEQQPQGPAGATEQPEKEPPPDESTAEPPENASVADPLGGPDPPSSAAEPPGFDAHPQHVTVRAGEPVTLSAAVTGSPTPELQWQMRDRQAAGWVDVRGEDGSDMELPDPTRAFDGRGYRVVATNGSGTATSDVAMVTVHYQPVVVAEPDDVDGDFGDQVVLRAAADASPTVDSARWQVRGENGWSDVSGAATSGSTTELVLEDVDFDDEATYRAAFSNEIGTAFTSPATVSVVASGTLEADVQRWAGPNASVKCVEPTGDGFGFSECGTSTWRLSADGGLRWSDGTCLDVRDVRGRWPHATMASCTETDSQRWTIDPADAEPQRLENDDGACLAAYPWHPRDVLALPCGSSWGRQIVFVLDDS